MQRYGFIDWMKAVGMLLIVMGHIIGSPYELFNLISQPVYTKQLGVCFFIFVMGWSLANEHRRGFRVVFNRTFPVYFYGLGFALLSSSVLIFTINDIHESNYLPFILGVNVLVNYFPANPTTWYIGSYLHILLFWFFFLQGKPITKKHLLIGVVCEVLIRASLLYANKDFIAYMLLPNWLTVFLLGGYFYQQADTRWQPRSFGLLICWGVVVLLWASPLNIYFANSALPFREFANVDAQSEASLSLLKSLLISLVYIVNTFVFFEVFRRLPKTKIIEFFARNSLITFIIHMPLIYALHPVVYPWLEHPWSRKLTLILIIFIGCALISELIQRLINIKYLQHLTWEISEKVLIRLTKKGTGLR
jgi:fucose 4-O-acetylase-like acetyltransferase